MLGWEAFLWSSFLKTDRDTLLLAALGRLFLSVLENNPLTDKVTHELCKNIKQTKAALLRSLWAKLNFLTQHAEHYVGQKSCYLWVYQVVPIQFYDFRYNTDTSIEYWPILLLVTALIILLLRILYHGMLENTWSSYISQTENNRYENNWRSYYETMGLHSVIIPYFFFGWYRTDFRY